MRPPGMVRSGRRRRLRRAARSRSPPGARAVGRARLRRPLSSRRPSAAQRNPCTPARGRASSNTKVPPWREPPALGDNQSRRDTDPTVWNAH
jgi:hypothetical protein